jgi:MATE family multidrug resistance protein
MPRTLREFWQGPGGVRELLALAWPLVVSNSFWTLQIALDRILLSRHSSAEVAAAMPAAILFWTPFNLIFHTASYATTFVAQYTGAGRPERVGPAVWQSIWFSMLAGLAMLLLVPNSAWIVSFGEHEPELQALETVYFRCLCFSALPTALIASACSFYTGRGDSRKALFVNAVGLSVTGLVGYAWTYGRWGLPEWGIEGTGWATVVGSCCGAAVAFGLFLRPKHRAVFATLSGARFDSDLFGRLMRFGLPNGLFALLDATVFALFIFIVGRFGEAQMAATTIAFTINIFAILPPMGVGQAVEVLVGQRLGENRPELAERSTWTGLWIAAGIMLALGLSFVLLANLWVAPFANADDPMWPAIAPLVPVLLRFVAAYCLFDSVNLVFSFALRGAGDTRFVTAVALGLAFAIMVAPTWLAWKYNWGLNWAWAFASAYVIALATTFFFRFRHGAWKSMRVIEPMADEPLAEEVAIR